MRKLFRKAVLLSLAVSVTASLAACSASEDPKEVFDEAVSKNSELSDMDTDMTMTMDMTMDDMPITMSMDMSMQVSGMQTDAMLYYSDSTMVLSSPDIDQTAIDTVSFYEDGYCYTEVLGQKMKYAMDLDSMMETLKQSTAAANMQSEMMSEITLSEENGQRVLSFTADPEKLNTQTSEALGLLNSQFQNLGINEGDIAVTEANGTYTLNEEGYYTAMTMTMVYDMTVAGSSVTADCDIQMTIHNPGEPVEVSIPDTSDYTEISLTE